jgi:hypothetical protein
MNEAGVGMAWNVIEKIFDRQSTRNRGSSLKADSVTESPHDRCQPVFIYNFSLNELLYLKTNCRLIWG